MTPVAEDQALANRPTWTPLAVTPIETDAEYRACAEHLKAIKRFQKSVADFFKPHKDRAYAAWKALCADETRVLQPALDDERACKAALATYDEQQERARLAEEQRLRELARQEEETRRLHEAAALERDGAHEEAAAVLEEPIRPAAVLVQKETPKVSGISFRENWSAKVVSLPKLIAFVAAHPEHANLLMPNTAALNGLARSLKQGMRIDGVEAVCQKTTAAGTRL
jgi:hypothetical protein